MDLSYRHNNNELAFILKAWCVLFGYKNHDTKAFPQYYCFLWLDVARKWYKGEAA